MIIYVRPTNTKLAKHNTIVNRRKERYVNLLLDFLPAEIAEELTEKGEMKMYYVKKKHDISNKLS